MVQPMASGALSVFLSGVRVAEISRSRGGDLSLRYVEGARALDATPLSLALPRSAERYSHGRVSHWIDGLVPERSEARQGIARHHGLDSTDAFDLLHAIGLDCAGAVQFCAPGGEERIARVGRLKPESNSEIEARLAEMEMDEFASWTKSDEHWSLAGYQPKFTLRHKNARWYSAHGSEPSTHIFKPGVHAIRMQSLDEHITLDAARRLGLNCAESNWVEFKSQSAIVVERYDRRVDTDGGVTRLHQEDLHQAIGLGKSKYDKPGKNSVTAEAILDALKGWSTSREEEDFNIRGFVDALVFSAVSASTDGHAKNYSVFLNGESVRLAPLYDIASDLPYSLEEDTLAMAIGGERRYSALETAHWASLAGAAGLETDYVLGRVRFMTDGAHDAFAEAFAGVGDAADEMRDHTLPVLDEHVNDLAARARRGVMRGPGPGKSAMSVETRSDEVLVPEHTRNGRTVRAHLRRSRRAAQ